MNETEEVEQTTPPEENPETQVPTPENPEISETLETPPKKPMNPKVLGGIVGAVAVVGLCVSLFSGGSDTSADDMRLEKYQGSVSLENSAQQKEIIEGARLISQDNLETLEESAAYISLDSAKVLKLDEESHMEVQQVDDNLDIELYKGSLYFSVTEPLTDTETLEFHTNNVVTGVRGTSGVITYTEDVLQSQVVVLSGTVEVITIEEEPETVLVSQGEIAIATTQEDGSVDLVVKEQEKIPSYSFSTNFLDDSGETVEEYTLPDWKEAYAQHLGEIESYYAGHPDLELETLEEYELSNDTKNSHPVDLSATTYWLHDMDLDGIPELFLGFYYPSRGFITDQWGNSSKVEATRIRTYALFGEEWRDSSVGAQQETSNGDWFNNDYRAIPPDGIGLYWQLESTNISDPERSYSGTTCLATKGAEEIVWTDYWEEGMGPGDFPPLLDGTPISSYTWTHYTDLSGLEWNG